MGEYKSTCKLATVQKLLNHSDEAVTLENSERVAQLVITPFLRAIFNEVDELSDTVRGVGGFGSTGRN